MNKEFEKNFKLISKAQKEMDAHVWDIFRRYLKIHQISFSGPSGWYVEDGYITMYGDDGCMGHYTNMTVEMELKYFLNPDEEFEKLIAAREAKAEAEKGEKAAALVKQELKELQRLLEKHGVTNE